MTDTTKIKQKQRYGLAQAFLGKARNASLAFVTLALLGLASPKRARVTTVRTALRALLKRVLAAPSRCLCLIFVVSVIAQTTPDFIRPTRT
jgi:hypothetical protein